MMFIAECLSAFCPPGHSLSTLCASTTAGSLGVLSSIFTTSMGVREGAARLADEVTAFISRNSGVSHLSLVGTSLGGLYCRAAAPAIAERHPRITCVNLVSFASPHIGVRNHLAWILQTAVNLGGAGATGRELMLADRSGESGMPLLAWMAHPASPYAAALCRFSNVIFLTNAIGDDKVPFHSARVSAAEGGPSVGSVQSLTAIGVPAADLEQYPHVTGVYRSGAGHAVVGTAQDFTASSITAAAPAAGDATSSPAAGSTSASPVTASHVSHSPGPAMLAADRAPDPSEPGLLERWMATCIRETLARAAPRCTVTTVECTFTEWPAALVNHLRIAVSKPWLTGELGKEVPRLLARHLFVYPATDEGASSPSPPPEAPVAQSTVSAPPAPLVLAPAVTEPRPPIEGRPH